MASFSIRKSKVWVNGIRIDVFDIFQQRQEPEVRVMRDVPDSGVSKYPEQFWSGELDPVYKGFSKKL